MCQGFELGRVLGAVAGARASVGDKDGWGGGRPILRGDMRNSAALPLVP